MNVIVGFAAMKFAGHCVDMYRNKQAMDKHNNTFTPVPVSDNQFIANNFAKVLSAHQQQNQQQHKEEAS